MGSADADVEEAAPVAKGLAFAMDACDETADPAVGDAVGVGDLALRAALDEDGGNDETGLRHPAEPARIGQPQQATRRPEPRLGRGAGGRPCPVPMS